MNKYELMINNKLKVKLGNIKEKSIVNTHTYLMHLTGAQIKSSPNRVVLS